MIFISKGHVIKHRAMQDVAFKVTTAIYGHSGDLIVFGHWLNDGYKRRQVIDRHERSFRIAQDKQQDWIIILASEEIQPYVRGA